VRKYLAIVLGLILILSFASVVFAEPDITLGGKILIRGWYFENVGTYSVTIDPPGPPPPFTKTYNNVPVDTKSQAVYTTNAYITIDAKVTDNVRGFMELETTSGGSGNPNTGLFFWGAGQDTKPASDMFFRQLWIQYTGSGLLGVPSGMKVGHMPLTLGEKQFLNNERFGDDAIMLWVDPTKELHLAVGTVKLQEGVTTLGTITNTDDIDGYVFIGTYKIDKKNTVGANWTYIHSDGPDAVTDDNLNFHNVGFHADGNVSGLTYAAEVDFQFGTMDYISAEDRDFSGWGIFANLGYMIDPVNVRASFAYGSGDDTPGGDIDEFQTLQGPDAIGPLARWVHYTQIYERTIRTTASEQLLSAATRNTSIANTTYYNLGFDVNPVKELSLSLDGFLIYASETPSGVNDDAGSELDFKGTYKIAKNLNYFVEAGAFWPGDYYKDTFGVDKTVTQVIHGVCLTF
jgi:hypothetical protein